jgi:hypothetical protein
MIRSLFAVESRACVARAVNCRTPRLGWRSFSTPAPADTLPLGGIRVVDMTRVLAGVSAQSSDQPDE